MRSTTSPHSVSSVSTNASSVWVTTPSVEFSTGTTPRSDCPRSTAANTAGMDCTAQRVAEAPKLLPRERDREFVPSGPR